MSFIDKKMPNDRFFPVRIWWFWMIFFGLFRVFFILKNRPKSGASDIWRSLWKAWPLDVSTAAGLTAIPLILWVFGAFLHRNWLKNTTILVLRLTIIGAVFVFLANIFLYESWSTVINRRAILYLKTPRALLDSLTRGQIFWIFLSTVFALVFFGRRFDRVLLTSSFFYLRNGIFYRISWVILMVFGCFLLLRGGRSGIPISESAVYFSQNAVSNHAALNPIWHLAHDFLEHPTEKNNYRFFEKNKADSLVKSLYFPQNLPEKQLEIGKINVVLIAMESLGAPVFEDTSATPNLNQIARRGCLFSNVYASGFRTDQGLVSLLCGYPAQPDRSIMVLSEKAEKLPSLPRFFAKNNYFTCFFYGGDLNFANLSQFLHNQKFKEIGSKKDFSKSEITQNWGADDGRFFTKFSEKLDALPEPFFATGLTLSLHTPFDVPNLKENSGLSEVEKFRNAARFADQAIGDFIEKNKSKKWFSNTVFVLAADHGGNLPGGISMESAEAHRIPVIFFGDKLPARLRQKNIQKIGCQHDLPATILGLFGAQNVDFQWSKDLFSSNISPEFGYWVNEHFLGWRDSTGVFIYDFEQNKWRENLENPAALGFLQSFYDDFLLK